MTDAASDVQLSEFFATGEGQAEPNLAEYFHENTKLTEFEKGGDPRDGGATDPGSLFSGRVAESVLAGVEAVVAQGGKRYPAAPRIELPEPGDGPHDALITVLSGRESAQGGYARDAVEKGHLSLLFKYAYGWNTARRKDYDGGSLQRKYVPSAGGLYPLEVYALQSHEPGSAVLDVHHYNPVSHALERINIVPRAAVEAAFVAFPDPALVVVVTAVLPRLAWKYGERGYRYALLEAGHVGQNLVLVAQALGMAACPIAGYYDDRVHDLIDADGASEVAVYAFFLGYPQSESAGQAGSS